MRINVLLVAGDLVRSEGDDEAEELESFFNSLHKMKQNFDDLSASKLQRIYSTN